MRKGITPVVAMVLLLMMTVAAAGGAYVWTQGIIGGQQEQAEEQLNTEVQVRDLQCAAGGTDPELDFFLSNTGSTTVGGDMTVYLYNVSTGDLATTTSLSPGDIQPGDNLDSTTNFSDVDMVNGLDYRVEFEFVNQGSYTVTGTCQAE